MLPGFYSMQTISVDDSVPSITQYHRKPEPAVGWKNRMVKRRIFDAYALCSSEARCDVYDAAGAQAGVRTSILAESGMYLENQAQMSVDKDQYEKSVKDILGKTVCCITFAEHHANASSVGHSNMVAVARHIVCDADDEDMNHIYLADSIASGCRVQGWFIDTQKVSAALMDKYLDRYKWLANGWPLANDHHTQVLGYRMATMRRNQIYDLMMTVSNLTNVGEHQSLMIMRLQQAPTEIMILFCSQLLEGMEAGILIHSQQAMEILDSDVLFQNAARIAALYKSTFL